MELFDRISGIAGYPDLMLYLRASVPHLVSNIQKRGRDYEQQIPLDYLAGLNKRYEDWMEKYNKGEFIIVDLTKLDFVSRDEDLGVVYNMIDAEINSLFS